MTTFLCTSVESFTDRLIPISVAAARGEGTEGTDTSCLATEAGNSFMAPLLTSPTERSSAPPRTITPDGPALLTVKLLELLLNQPYKSLMKSFQSPNTKLPNFRMLSSRDLFTCLIALIFSSIFLIASVTVDLNSGFL